MPGSVPYDIYPVNDIPNTHWIDLRIHSAETKVSRGCEGPMIFQNSCKSDIQFFPCTSETKGRNAINNNLESKAAVTLYFVVQWEHIGKSEYRESSLLTCPLVSMQSNVCGSLFSQGTLLLNLHGSSKHSSASLDLSVFIGLSGINEILLLNLPEALGSNKSVMFKIWRTKVLQLFLQSCRFQTSPPQTVWILSENIIKSCLCSHVTICRHSNKTRLFLSLCCYLSQADAAHVGRHPQCFQGIVWHFRKYDYSPYSHNISLWQIWRWHQGYVTAVACEMRRQEKQWKETRARPCEQGKKCLAFGCQARTTKEMIYLSI